MGSLRPKIILFGDSITEFSCQSGGWGAALADHYSRKADVVFRGFGGYNTRWALSLVDRLFPIPSSDPPLLVTVFFGANDASLPGLACDFQHVPLPEYKQNLHQIVSHLKSQSDSTHIVIIAPPPVFEKELLTVQKSWGVLSDEPTRLNSITKLYAQECVKVAEEAGVQVIDTWSILQKTPEWEQKYLCDGLHLSSEGNAILFEELVKLLDEPGLAPTLKAADLPFDLPIYPDVNWKNPEAFFKTWFAQK